MVLTVSFVLSPVTGFIVTVIRVMRSIIANLTPASGRQDHTTSPSALAPFVKGDFASTASRPASVTIASRPSVGQDNRDKQVIWARRQVIFRKIRNEGPGWFQVICPAI
jgi:hypothetical protein